MTGVEIIVCSVRTEIVYICIDKVFASCDIKHFGSVGSCQKLALRVEQFQCVPLCGIMTGCDDNATIGIMMAHSQLCCRSCSKSKVYNVETHTEQCSTNNTSHHLSRNACIATHHDARTMVCLCIPSDKSGVSRSEFYYVKWIKRIAGSTADCTAYA